MAVALNNNGQHQVVIVGGGFGGLYAAKALNAANVNVTLIDKRNFHLFQPLLYQVATGTLSPSDISAPLRSVFSKSKNTKVLLGEVNNIDPKAQQVILGDEIVPYDTLIVATGANHSYFGKDHWEKVAPGLKSMGMVTDASWADLDADNIKELIITGDWMPVTIFKYLNGQLKKTAEIKNSSGWWNAINITDVNKDGRPDIIAANWGLNSKLKADSLHPAKLYVNDFDKNGQIECVTTYFKSDGLDYPYFLRGDMSTQLPFLKKKFLRYDSYAGKTITEIFSKDQLSSATMLQVSQAQTGIFYNLGNLNFNFKPLPVQAQLSNMFSILVQDINADGIKDIFLAGNFAGLKPELGRMDASYGVSLLGTVSGDFIYSPSSYTGLFIKGEVRDAKEIKMANRQSAIIMALNNEPLQVFKMKINKSIKK